MDHDKKGHKPQYDQTPDLTIIGGLALFTVVLGTTDLGFIPVPTEAKFATTMHLPTIIASLLEGWPVGMIIGAIFGGIAMYTPGTPMASDPLVALLPRMLVGLTPYLAYVWMRGRNEYLRLAVAAVVGTLTNTTGFLSMAVLLGYMTPSVAFSIAIKHGIPEVIVAVIFTIPAMALFRKFKVYLDKLGH